MKNLLASISPERAQRVLAIASISVLVAGVSSIGQVRFELDNKSADVLADEQPGGGTSTDPSTGLPTTTPTSPGAKPSASAVPGRSTAPGTSPGTSSGGNVRPPGGAVVDKPIPGVTVPKFGLKTQGVTPKDVRIGVSYNVSGCGPDGQVSAMFNAATAGDPSKAYPAFVRYVNETGGISGRTLKLDVEDNGGGSGSCASKAIASAKAMADDNKDFLAIPGLHTESDYIMSRNVPVFGGRDDPAALKKIGANGLMVSEPLQEAFRAWASLGKNVIDTPKHKACFVHPSSDESGDWDTYAKVMNAEMARAGMAFTDEIVYKNDVATAQQQATSMATRVKTKGCDQVYVTSTNPIAWIFFTQAMSQAQHYPLWTFTSYTVLADSDLAGGLMDQKQWEKSIGLSSRVPASANHPAQGNCARIYNKYYNGDGQSGSVAVQVACAQILTTSEMMRQAVRTTGVLTGDSLLMGAASIRGGFYYDATVPMSFSFPDRDGPFVTKGYHHMTIIRWDRDSSTYLFPDFPKYWTVIGARKGGAVDLRPFWKGYKVK